MQTELFPNKFLGKLPKASRDWNITTAVCGIKDWHKCEDGNIDCPHICVKSIKTGGDINGNDNLKDQG